MSSIEIFISYAHEDELLRQVLEKQLSILKRQGHIDVWWHDRNISAGAAWEHEIDKHLNTAQIILLLISPDFMASDYCYSIEMRQAMERHARGEALVIPVILRPVYWQGAPFGALQALPTDGIPVVSPSWHTHDAAFYNVAEGIRKAVEQLAARVATSQSKPVPDLAQTASLFQERQHVDWGEAPHSAQFYGRREELSELNRWVIVDRCQLIAVLGMGGIGKTSLVVKLIDQVQGDFSYVFWRSLQNAPPLGSFLEKCILFLSDQLRIHLPKDEDEQVALLVDYLRERRCLLIVDNVESILQAGNRAGRYREGYEGYGRLFRRIGEAKHQSCLLLTSRENPQEVAFLEGEVSLVRACRLQGLRPSDGREILKDKGLRGTDRAWEDLIEHYEGNPLALKLVSQFIREVFSGDIEGFLKEGEVLFSDIRDVLDQQFERLSEMEQAIIYWLAIEREAVSLNDIHMNSVSVRPWSRRELQEALRSLHRRHLIETSAMGFTLQNVVMEYVTDQLVNRVSEEIVDGRRLALFASHALMKALAKDFVRESQVRLILAPIAERLITTLGREGLELQLKQMLLALHQNHPRQSGYAAGNVLNLVVQSGYDLRGYDFSQLEVRQAYLRGVPAREVSFAHAQLLASAFTDTFGRVFSVALSPNGDLLAAGTAHGEVWLWRTADGTPLLVYSEHTSWIRSIAFSPDGTLLASASDDHTVRLWEVSTGTCLATLHGHIDQVRAVAFSPDGTLLASASDDQTIRLWEVKSGYHLKTILDHISPVRAVAFNPDGTLLASASDDQAIRLWEVNSGQCLKTLQGHAKRIHSVDFSPDGALLASGGDDQVIRLWEVNSGQCLKTLQGHANRIWSLAFSPDGALLASGSEDQAIRLWEVSSGQCLKTLQGHTDAIRAVAFGPKEGVLASGSFDQTVRVWEISTGHCLNSLQGYANVVRAVAFDPKGGMLASGGFDQIVRVWEVSTGACRRELRGHNGPVRSVAYSPDGSKLASASDDGTARLWEIDTGVCLIVLHGHTSSVGFVAFSPDGTLLASGSDDWTVRLWEVNTGNCRTILKDHTNEIISVAFNPDGTLLASGSDDRTVRLWEIDTGACLSVLHGHTSSVGSIAFSPDGTLLASGSDDRTVRLWEVGTGTCSKILYGHTDQIRSIAFSPDGTLLASGSDDRTVRLWEVGTDTCSKTLYGHTDQIRSIAFSPDGTLLASGSHDGTIKIWGVQNGENLMTLMVERPYERMDITQVTGLTDARKAMLKSLGAIEGSA